MERFIIEKTMFTFPSHSLEEQRRNSTKPPKANQRLFFKCIFEAASDEFKEHKFKEQE